jgi:hypothetical protein
MRVSRAWKKNFQSFPFRWQKPDTCLTVSFRDIFFLFWTPFIRILCISLRFITRCITLSSFAPDSCTALGYDFFNIVKAYKLNHRYSICHESSVYWYITLRSPLKVGWRFRGRCNLHLRSRKISQARNHREAGGKQLYVGFFPGFFDPEDRGNTFLWNVGWLSVDYTAFYSRVRTHYHHRCDNLKSYITPALTLFLIYELLFFMKGWIVVAVVVGLTKRLVCCPKRITVSSPGVKRPEPWADRSYRFGADVWEEIGAIPCKSQFLRTSAWRCITFFYLYPLSGL